MKLQIKKMSLKRKGTLDNEFSTFFPNEYIRRASKILKLVSEESKLRIMLLLAKEGPCTVTEISTTLRMIQPTASRNLALLRAADLVTSTRDGKNIFYDIDENTWREMGRQFFDYLQKGNDVHFLGKFVLRRLSK